MKKLLLLLVFLIGCAASPDIVVNKNVTIIVGGIDKEGAVLLPGVFPIWINVEYKTTSDLDTKLDTKQNIKPKTTIPFKGL